MIARLLVVVVLAVGVLALSAWYARAKRRERDVDPLGLPPLEPSLFAGDATWVIFTTQYCATCGPVKERISRLDPTADIIEIDVAHRPELAERYRVRTAPTILFAAANGRIQARFVGNVPDADLATARA